MNATDLIFERKRIQASDILAWFTLIIAGAFKFVEPWFSFVDNRNTYFMMVLLVLTGLTVLFKIKSDRAFTNRVILLVISVCTLIIGDMGIAYSVCVAIIISYLPFKRAMSLFLIVGLVLLLFNIFCHFVFDFKVEANTISSTGVLRHSLGFDYPNTGPILFLLLVSGFVLVINKHKILWYTLLTILTLLLYCWTISRTFLISMILLLAAFIPVALLARTKKLYLLIPTLFIVFTIFSFMLGTIFDNAFFNRLLSGRPYYFMLYIKNNSIAYISGRFYTFDSTWYLDNLFLYLLYRVGLPVYILSFGGIYYLFYKAKRIYSTSFFTKLCLSFTLLMIASISENFLALDFNPAYIVLMLAFIQSKNNKTIYKFIDVLPTEKKEKLKELVFG